MRVTPITGMISSRRANSRRRTQLLAIAALAACGSTAALAAVPPPTTQPIVWDGPGTPTPTPAPYTTATNWDLDIVPDNEANHFARIDNGGIATITTGDAAEAAFLNLGTTFGQTGELRIDAGTLTVGEMRVGGRETLAADHNDWGTTLAPNDGGTGTVVQTGGTVNVTYTHGQNIDLTNFEPPIQSLYIGDSGLAADNHAVGSYSISGAGSVLLVGIQNNDAIVIGTGAGTQGTFVQQDGSVTSTGFVTVARGGATASYTMSGGTLNVGTGTRSSNQNLRLGDGEYPGGTFANSTGTFTQSGGTVTVMNDTTVGRNTGTGSYTITGATTVLDGQNNINVGHGGTGTFVQGTAGQGLVGPTVKAGSTATGTRGMSVGISGNATLPGVGTYTLRSGELQIGNGESADYLAVGDGINGNGTFNMEGGKITISDLLQVGRNNSAFDTNAFNMSGGEITTGRVVIGGGSGAAGGKGTFTMTGGSLSGSVATNLGFGGSNNTSVGTLDIQGGTYTLTGTGNNGILAVGNTIGGTGIVKVSGGVLTVNETGSVIDVGRNNAGGSVTLSGTGQIIAQLLRAPNRSAGTGVRTIDFNGGSSTIPTVTLDDATMTINGGTHDITTANVNADAQLNLNTSSTFAALNLAGGTVTVGAGGANVLRATALAVPTGKVDLKDNKLITSSPAGTWDGVGAYTEVAGLVDTARGTAGNAMWDGASGITTTDTRAINNGDLVSIGVAKVSEVRTVADTATTTFAGQTVLGSDTLVMATWGGDANLDGKINIDDYGRIDGNVGQSGSVFGWSKGDFNYDGKINIDDYGIIDGNINRQGTPFSTSAALDGVAAVPEPAAGIAAMGLLAVLMRRRHRGS